MRRRCIGAALCAWLLLALPAVGRGQSFGFPWWRDAQFQKDLALTSDQAARIESVFQAAMPKLREGKERLDRLEAELSHMIETNADEAAVTRQVDKVEEIRAYLNKTRTFMLLHMRQVLTPDQRVRLKALHENFDRDRRGKSRDDHKQ